MADRRTAQTTLITAAGTGESSDDYGCPGVHIVDGRTERYVITRQVHDPVVLDALAPHVGVDDQGRPEQVGEVPPWVTSVLMDLDGLRRLMQAHLRHRGDEVFRLEALPQYAVVTDGDDYTRWLAGASEPTWSRKQPWLDQLARDRDAGIRRYRVRRFGRQLTPYELYSCEWGYSMNAASGEDIRVLRDGEHDVPELSDTEYWLVNDRLVVPVQYDRRGRFVGAGTLTPDRLPEFQADRDAAWAAAEPFTEWWARHPELHETRKAA